MPNPSTSLATLRPDLGGSMMEFDLAADREGFVGHRALPVFNSRKKYGPYGVIPIEQLLKNADTERVPGSGYSRGKFTFTTGSFTCQEHGHEEPVDDAEAEIYADYFDVEQVAAQRALDVVLRNAEKRAADLLFNATTWTGSLLTTAVTNEWDDAANATPRADVLAGKLAVYAGCGLWPDTLIINRKVFLNVRETDDIIDHMKYQGFQDVRAENITAQALAMVFDLRQVLVAGGSKNTAQEGQSASVAQIWSDEYAMICKVASRPNDIKEPCIGRTIHYSEDGSMPGGTIESYRDEAVRSDIIRVRHDVDEKVLYTQAGHLLSNITT